MGNKPATTTTNTNSTTSRDPWAAATPHLKGILDGVGGISADQFKTLYSDTTRQGIDYLKNLANDPNGAGGYDAINNVVGGSGQGFNAGLGQLMATANGSMINSNPYFDSVVDRAATDTANKVNSMFTAGGRYGSGAHAGTLGREVGNTVAQMRNANYAAERGMQDQASRTLYGGGFQGAGFGSAMDQAQLRPAQLALQAGGLTDQMLNSDRTAPMNHLQWQAGMVNPIAQQGGTSNTQGTQTQQTKQPTNWMTTGLGVGMMGLGALTGNPGLMASGGGGFGSGMLGGLGGLFGGGNVNGYVNNDPGGSYYY